MLLVVVGIQFLSLGLIGELVTTHHEERAAERESLERHVDEILSREFLFGTYQRDYPRNSLTLALLRKAGVSVVERHEPVGGRRNAWRAGALTALRLARAELRLARRLHGEFDAALVGYPGHLDVLAARRALPDVPLILNPLVSLSDTLVGDRARFRPGRCRRGPRAVDRRAFAAADVVVADTRAHAELFVARRTRSGGRARRRRGTHLSSPWHPAAERSVLFVGKLIPLHGLETILGAAAALPDVRFRVIGEGQLDDVLRGRPPTSSGSAGSSTTSSATSTGPPPARSASSEPRRRRHA